MYYGTTLNGAHKEVAIKVIKSEYEKNGIHHYILKEI